jgi:hypothetical protein
MSRVLIILGFVAMISISTRTPCDVARTIAATPAPNPTAYAPRLQRSTLETSGQLGVTKKEHQR